MLLCIGFTYWGSIVIVQEMLAAGGAVPFFSPGWKVSSPVVSV